MKIKKLFGRGKSKNNGFVGSTECGQFVLDFYYDEQDMENSRVEIRCGTVMDVTLKANHDGYGFLISCYHDGATAPMEAYCGFLWQCSHLLAMDSYFPKRVNQSWQKYITSLQKRAKAAAQQVTAEQNEADEALMNEAVRIADMPAGEREKLHDDIVERLEGAVKGETNDGGVAEGGGVADGGNAAEKTTKNKKK